MALIRVIDVETVGEGESAELIEIGAQDLVGEGQAWLLGDQRTDLIKPLQEVDASSCGIHHITQEMVADALPRKEVLAQYAGAEVYAAHNAKFEMGFIKFQSPVICTYKLAMHLWPEAPNHKLATLRYWRFLKLDIEKSVPPHRALPDAYICAMLLRHMLKTEITLEQAIEVSSKPVIMAKVMFGKHAGAKWADVPRGYLEWVVKNVTDDEDVAATAQFWLNGGRA